MHRHLRILVAEEIRHATQVSDHLNTLIEYVINGWLSISAEVKEETQQYWPYNDVMVVVDVMVMKGRRIVVPTALK